MEMVKLISKNEKTFEIAKDVAVQSVTIKKNLRHGCSAISLPFVEPETLAFVIEFLKKNHADAASTDAYFRKYVGELFGRQGKKDVQILFPLIAVAEYLKIGRLTDLFCLAAADEKEHKSVEEIKGRFQIEIEIENDNIPEVDDLGFFQNDVEDEANWYQEEDWAFYEY